MSPINKREQIILAALKVLGKSGIQGMTMAAVAKSADVGKSTLYEYFDSKATLILEATIYFTEVFIKRTYETALRKGNDFNSTFRIYILLMLQGLDSELAGGDSVFNRFKELAACDLSIERYKQAMRPVFEQAFLYYKEMIAMGQSEGVLRMDIHVPEIYMAQKAMFVLALSMVNEDFEQLGLMELTENEKVDYLYRFITKALT